jgi:hypothetical protein
MTILKTPFIDGLLTREFDAESGSLTVFSTIYLWSTLEKARRSKKGAPGAGQLGLKDFVWTASFEAG